VPQQDERIGRAVAGVDKLKRKYGRDAVVPASLLSRLSAARAADRRAAAERQTRRPQTHQA
jgi:hypothetical protein